MYTSRPKAGIFIYMKMLDKIAIQGYRGSFHEIAAFKFFNGPVATIECGTFQHLFDVMSSGEAKYAIMAIENSVAGSILENYSRLRDANLEIFGEAYLRIEMNLMALHGQTVEDIEEVHSHPMALLQVREYFRKYPDIQLTESKDTALSAQEIKEHHIRNRGAIASRLAAEIFGLEILAAGIETNKRNFTRFLALRRRGEETPLPIATINKSSIVFRVHDKAGSLVKVLNILDEYHINMSKVQSTPVLGEEWQYFFYVDLEFDEVDAYHAALHLIQPWCFELQVLGEYKTGDKKI